MATSSPSDLLGTARFKFSPTTETGIMEYQNGILISESARYHCITLMKEYKHKSLEELRLEDYTLNKKDEANVVSPANTAVPKGELFATNSSRTFAVSNSNLFGSSNLTMPTCSASTFNSTNPAKSSTVLNTESDSRSTRRASRRVNHSNSPCFDTSRYLVKAGEFEKRGIPLFIDASTQTEEKARNTSTNFSFKSEIPLGILSIQRFSQLFLLRKQYKKFTFGSPVTSDSGNTSTSLNFETGKPPEISDKIFRFGSPITSGNTSTSFNFETGKPPVVNKLLQGLKEILLNSKHSDFALNVKGTGFRVHKIILEAQSPVFAAMLEHDTKEKADGIVNIDDCEPRTMSKFLDFLYTGIVENLSSDNVLDLYEVADKYEVTELSNLCIMYMKNNISIENFCDMLNFSLRYNVRELTEVTTEFFLQNSKEIAITADWGTFLDQNPVAGNELFLKALSLKKE